MRCLLCVFLITVETSGGSSRKKVRKGRRCKLWYRTPHNKISRTLLNTDGTSPSRNTAAVQQTGQWGPKHLKCIWFIVGRYIIGRVAHFLLLPPRRCCLPLASQLQIKVNPSSSQEQRRLNLALSFLSIHLGVASWRAGEGNLAGAFLLIGSSITVAVLPWR